MDYKTNNMTRKYKFLFLFIFSYSTFAQLGIGTETPQGILHIDPQSNTPNSSATETQMADDFIITSDGEMGLGTLTPSVKVDLRNNGNGALGLGNTNLTASQAGKGAMRYNNNLIQYSNGQHWIDLAPSTKTRSVIIATKTTQSVYINAGGGFTAAGGCINCTVNGVPHRNPAYITNWTTKYSNSSEGGTFNASTGVFTANRAGTFTATFTFALASGKVRAWNGSGDAVDSNQVEAIWRIFDTNGTTEINSIKCANTFPSDSRLNNNDAGNVMVGSNCTGTVYLQAGQSIRPSLWVDLAPDGQGLKPFDLTTIGGSSIYNNLTIIEN